jgi:hypothetical protein
VKSTGLVKLKLPAASNGLVEARGQLVKGEKMFWLVKT